MNDEPDPDRCPPGLEDFPYDVQMAIISYGKLGDRISSDIGYIGKDFTNLDLFIEIYNIDDKELYLETLLLLDQNMIEKSNEAVKRERDKLKKK